ncbi:jerky protein homolog-like [Halyomorpha halys]|uniref:jerky protein homolog-like n=1 Tax=Halyomorpha halys TaxID=286706 RepID=UPI0006D4D5B9|nr:jerky protein homolog-like [Halyomorpha halys]XP_024220054.1 jerky protein homolog-like [Halyomorpha halys]XP_024220055.1 jerky protein homolog-like [Halyomorpha halys]XP_024220056.1 jerky protein homolog-like [Halyomorpha halys]
MAENKKRKSYTVEEKLAIINRVKNGASKAQLKRELGIPESTIRGWVDEEEKLISFINNVDNNSALRRKRTRMGKLSDLEKCLFTWFVQKRSEGEHISGPILKEQAEKFHQDLGIKEKFAASDGWLWRWQKRHGVREFNAAGENRFADQVSTTEFPQSLSNFISENNYNEELIFNCGETTLYYRMLPSKSLYLEQETNKSRFKLSTDRMTLLLCVNRTGKCKLPPLCIDKNRNPHCFNLTDMSTLPVKYASTPNAWMTGTLFHEWFHHNFVPHLRKYAQENQLEPKGLLLLENCPAHPPAESLISDDGKIKALFLPKKTASIIQPLEQGIIHTFKVHYRRELLLSLLKEKDVSSFLKSLNLKETIYRIGLAWGSITELKIRDCWENIFKENLLEPYNSPKEIKMLIESSHLSSLCEILGENELTEECFNEWVKIDSDEKPYNVLTDEDIVNVVVTVDQPIEDEDSGEDTSATTIPTDDEALTAIDVLLAWMEGHQSSIEPTKLQQIVSIKSTIMKEKQLKINGMFLNQS